MRPFILVLAVLCGSVPASHADPLQLAEMKPDPYGYPRPAPNATHVPVATSFFFQIGFTTKTPTDAVLADSVSVRLESKQTDPVDLLKPGQVFSPGDSVKFRTTRKPKNALAVYIDSDADLLPGTTYTVVVHAKSRDGDVLDGPQATWQFTTAQTESVRDIDFALDLNDAPTQWHGGFFTGFCKPSFCTSASNRISGYELMQEVRRQSPRAWSLQRDFSPTSTGHQPEFLNWSHPNVVRERETRRIADMQPREDGVLLKLEDFFGHEQYGIDSNRPVSDDYHTGDEVLIADGVSDARAKVLRIIADSENERSILVSEFQPPKDGWKITYSRPLPTKEDPNAPGWFPFGGCYLRKLNPTGTPHYYWGRIDKEWDIACRRFNRRLVVNFTDAPGDLAIDGRQWTYPKDSIEYHAVVRAYTSHLIERYGDRCLDFVWSVFNEPDLAVAFWRSRDWNELQRFYDYTTDAVLRSFEDHGYDSSRVIIGGLEIGAIFGTHIEGPILKTFLGHCSPTAVCKGELEQNAAFNDTRLDGQRSRRVEKLCRANGGMGAPCDFVSVHTYNAAPMAAAKLHRAKQLALEVDADYFAHLSVNSFESCPGWAPPPDVAAADSYLGNGYFATWCADVARRRLTAASQDARYGFGEAILTFWPWPNSNFGGNNNATQVIDIDDDGDGKKDREETLALPILHFLGLLARMSNAFWVLPERTIDDHTVSGFASRQGNDVRVLLYAHQPADIQSRSKDVFQLNVTLSGLPWRRIEIAEYRFDQQHNSYYTLARALRDRPSTIGRRQPPAAVVKKLVEDLSSRDRQRQLAAIERATTFAALPESVLIAAFQLHQSTKDEEVRAAIEAASRKLMTHIPCFTPDEIAPIKAKSKLQVTSQSTAVCDSDRRIHVPAMIRANSASFLVLTRADRN